MEEYSNTTATTGLDSCQTDAETNVNTSPEPTETTTPAMPDPNLLARGEQASSGSMAEAQPRPSCIRAPEAISASSGTGDSDEPVTKPVVKVSGIPEIARQNASRFTEWKPPFEVEKGFETDFDEIIQRAEFVRAPLSATPAPTGSAPYGSIDELFFRLREAFAAQAFLPAETSALLSFWAVSTWFTDGLSLAPGLTIVGPPHEGDMVLRTLRNFCRFPLMMAGSNLAEIKKLNWNRRPTLLLFDPYVTTQVVTMLGCTTRRGYMVSDAGCYLDLFGAKAVYLGAEASADRTPRCSLQVSVNPSPSGISQIASRLSESTVQELQNQLLRYRLKTLCKVYNSDFDAATLTSEARAVANALGACVPDSPRLQSELISLLTSIDDQRLADRSTGVEAVTLEAILNLSHQGKDRILVGEIATEVNRITKTRGERLTYSAETVGHHLKKVGLITRRLGKAGKGLVFDLATQTRVHELARVYGGAGLEQDEKNLHCAQCIDNPTLM
jgi:DNA-binding transcriptional ArsR family regulator